MAIAVVAVAVRTRSLDREGGDCLAVGELLDTPAHFDRLVQGFHPDPCRLTTRLLMDLLHAGRDTLQRGNAAVVTLVGFSESFGEAADLPLALEHHLRKDSQLLLQPSGRAHRVALQLDGGLGGHLLHLTYGVGHFAFEGADPLLPRGNGRVHLGAAVAEEGPLEATHARHRKGGGGRILCAARYANRCSTKTGLERCGGCPNRVEAKLQARRVAPQLFEPVTLARLGGEDVKNAVEVVEDDPARPPLRPPRTAGQDAPCSCFNLHPHLVDDRPGLTLAARRADDQKVRVRKPTHACPARRSPLPFFRVGYLRQALCFSCLRSQLAQRNTPPSPR